MRLRHGVLLVRSILFLLFPVVIPASVASAIVQESSGDDPAYAATHHGLITWEGASGLFINPTSATLRQGQLAVNYCVLVFRQDERSVAGHQSMAAYGVTDWIEVGVTGLLLDDVARTTLRGGPLLRVRLLQESAGPEVSAGAIVREGNELLSRRTLFLAASKRLAFEDGGFVRGLPLHAGLRQLWIDGDDYAGLIAFAGGEIELPRGIFLMAEITNRSHLFRRTPYSFGLQVRRPDGFGFSLAGIQTGNQDDLGVLVGIGISFER